MVHSRHPKDTGSEEMSYITADVTVGFTNARGGSSAAFLPSDSHEQYLSKLLLVCSWIECVQCSVQSLSNLWHQKSGSERTNRFPPCVRCDYFLEDNHTNLHHGVPKGETMEWKWPFVLFTSSSHRCCGQNHGGRPVKPHPQTDLQRPGFHLGLFLWVCPVLKDSVQSSLPLQRGLKG